MGVKRDVQARVVNKVVHYLENDPEKNFPKILNAGRWINSMNGHIFKNAFNLFDQLWKDKSNPWHCFMTKYLTELNPLERQKFTVNFLIYSAMEGFSKEGKLSLKYGCNIPWAILMDPTSACNLKCIGCWAAEYEKQDNLSLEDMESVITQGKELGVYVYLFSGGEPLMRKKDLIKLASRHADCVFGSFTNGTLIDEAFADELARVGNFFPIISIEGFENETDMRRGNGTYAKVIHAMDILNERHLAFGFSCCYHSQNVYSVASDEFIDFMIEKGAWFGWYFTYIPVGHGARKELMVNAEQREYMYHRVREIREHKPIFVLDFWNDGEYTEGCIAGGRRYFHINAAGQAEPCAFVHYSNMNIRDHSLLDILRSPLFMEYHDMQPFNNNHLRPCPMLDNPEALRKMVENSGAVSTQALEPESAEELTAKCEDAAEEWGKRANVLWKERCEEKSKQKQMDKAG